MWDMEQSRRLFAALAASPRFRDVRVCGYIQKTDLEKEQQFAAVLFRLNRNLSYVAFRGTDLSLVGWKENFNMAFQCPVPSQEEARRYVAEAARYCEGGLLLGGHSKGGNLAVYAAAKSEAPVWERIVRVYSHDGPGFLEEVVRTEGLVRAAAKVDKTLPQASSLVCCWSRPEPIVWSKARESVYGSMIPLLGSWTARIFAIWSIWHRRQNILTVH